MESVKTIRAIARAFDVLQALQSAPHGSSLVELQTATGLSGPTLLRILKSLQEARAVRRGSCDQRWRNSLRLDALTQSLGPVERLADVASVRLDTLCAQVRWPSDLAVHFGVDDFMTVLESTLRQSSFYVRRSRGSMQVNLLMSAVGTAYLSRLPAAQCAALVEVARKGRDPHNQSAIAADDLAQRLDRARRQGYAMRHPLYRGGRYNGNPQDDALAALAVPIVHNGKPYGAVNINWNRAAITEREMLRAHLKHLQEAAHGIEEDARQRGIFEAWPKTGNAVALP